MGTSDNSPSSRGGPAASIGLVFGVALAAALAVATWPDAERDVVEQTAPATTLADASTSQTGAAGTQTALVGAAVGQELPDVLFRLEDGRTARLSEYRGKVVFINVWATWCGPCVAELPMLDELFGELAEEDSIRMLAMSVDAPDISDVDLNAFARRVAPRLPLARDPDGSVSQALRTSSIPVTLVIDKAGIVRQRLVGMREWTRPHYAATLRDLAGEDAPGGG